MKAAFLGNIYVDVALVPGQYLDIGMGTGQYKIYCTAMAFYLVGTNSGMDYWIELFSFFWTSFCVIFKTTLIRSWVQILILTMIISVYYSIFSNA